MVPAMRIRNGYKSQNNNWYGLKINKAIHLLKDGFAENRTIFS